MSSEFIVKLDTKSLRVGQFLSKILTVFSIEDVDINVRIPNFNVHTNLEL